MKKVILGLILIVVIIILVWLVISVRNGIELTKLNSMYEDIEILDDKITIYYLNYGYIPVKNEVQFEHSINPNDNDIYYELDIEKIDNVYLNYGSHTNENDYYIINDESHTIYYFNGIEYMNNKYYTRNVNYSLVELK